MLLRYVSLVAAFIALLALPVWPYSADWGIYASGFFFLIAAVCFAVSIFGRRGSELWRGKGQR